MRGGEKQDHTSAICLLQDFPSGGSGWLGAETPATRSWACRIARLLTEGPLPVWRAALVSGRWQGGVARSVKVQCFAIVSPSGDPGARGLQGQLLCLNIGNLSSFLTSTFSLQFLPGPPTSNVANPDSYPLSQEECMLILTQGQRPEPRSELLSGLTRWWEAERNQSSWREQQGQKQVSALESEGRQASSAVFSEHRETAFWLQPDPRVANVLILSTSLCAQHSSTSFIRTDQFSPHKHPVREC